MVTVVTVGDRVGRQLRPVVGRRTLGVRKMRSTQREQRMKRRELKLDGCCEAFREQLEDGDLVEE